MTQSITPCLWFDDRIDEAAQYYIALFNGRQLDRSTYPDGRTLVINLELRGNTFMLLNGGPQFKFTEAVSFMIDCADQAEVDRFWDALVGDGGAESRCGWCRDKFGLSWQVVPSGMGQYLGGPDKAGAKRAMDAMMGMAKLDIGALAKAYAGA